MLVVNLENLTRLKAIISGKSGDVDECFFDSRENFVFPVMKDKICNN